MSTASGITMASMSTYAILGCGSVGHAVAEELVEEGKDVLILDADEGRVEALRDQDLNAQQADICETDVAQTVADRDVVLIMSPDVNANAEAVRNIRESGGEQFIVARADDPVSADDLTELGADVVINPRRSSPIRRFERWKPGNWSTRPHSSGTSSTGPRNAWRYLSTGRRTRTPSLQRPRCGPSLRAATSRPTSSTRRDWPPGEPRVRQSPRYRTDIERGRRPRRIRHVRAGGRCQGRRTGHRLGRHRRRPLRARTRTRTRRRLLRYPAEHLATSTILTKYIQELDLNLDQSVATALLYGIRAETLDFKRDTTPADLTAAAYLYPFADHDTLEQVESPSMSPETLDVLAEAIRNREVQGSHLVSNAGFIRDRDALAQAAQHLLNLEGITTTAVFAIADDTIYLAARSKDIRMNIGKVLSDAFGGMGETAGHSTDASVEIPLGIFTGLDTSDDNRDTLLELTEEAVKRKLFEAMGVDSSSESSNGN